LAIALVCYAVLGAVTWATVTEPRFRAITLAVLAMFAAKSWLRRKDMAPPNGNHDAE
jgi:hypothetical protein